MGRKGPRAKTKTVLKPVKQWEKHGSMPKSEFLTFLNKNHPNVKVRTSESAKVLKCESGKNGYPKNRNNDLATLHLDN